MPSPSVRAVTPLPSRSRKSSTARSLPQVAMSVTGTSTWGSPRASVTVATTLTG